MTQHVSDGHLSDAAPTRLDLTLPVSSQPGDRGHLMRRLQEPWPKGEQLDVDGHFCLAAERAVFCLQTPPATVLRETGVAEPTTFAAPAQP